MDLGTVFTSSAIVVFLLEWLKKQSWFTWLTEESTKRVKKAFALVFAVLSVAGIGYVYNLEAGTLTITGLTLTGILTALLEVVKQYIMQKLVYKVALSNGKTNGAPMAVVLPPVTATAQPPTTGQGVPFRPAG